MVISPNTVQRLERSRAVVDRIVNSKVPTYGINTGETDRGSSEIDGAALCGVAALCCSGVLAVWDCRSQSVTAVPPVSTSSFLSVATSNYRPPSNSLPPRVRAAEPHLHLHGRVEPPAGARELEKGESSGQEGAWQEESISVPACM